MIKGLRILLAFLAAAGMAACGVPETPAETAPAVRVATVQARADTGYEVTSSYSGRVEARLESRLGFEIGGQLAEVLVDDGSVVLPGDALARLDTARLAASRAEAAAAVDQVRADLELATLTLERTEKAFEHKGISRQQLDEARQRVAALEASVRVAGARLERIEVDLEKATLRAPFEGTVVNRFTDPGVVLAAGEPVIAMQSIQAPEARIGLSPDAAASLEVGDAYALSINGRPVAATLKTVVPRRDEASRTLDTIFVLDATTEDVRPGDLARIDVRRHVSDAGFWLPVAALIEGPRGLWQGLVAEPEDDGYVLTGRTLELIHADEDRAYVRGKLAPGDLVVSEGTHRVVAGQSVSIDSNARLAQAVTGPVSTP